MAQQNKFVFTTDEAASEGVTDHKNLTKLIETARNNLAEAPIKVGAVGRASSGQVYLGANVEFKGLSIHAEQFLITNLALNSEPELTHLAISDNGTVFHGPCDRCSQFLQEISNASQIEVLIKNENEEDGTFKSLESHMPDKFGSDSILPAEASLLRVQRDNRLALFHTDSAGRICSNWNHCSHLKCMALKMALKAANKSYAPHSKCPSGVALICEGKVFKGWYMETVANNVYLGPVQVALVDFMARGEGKGFDKITGAVLVEKKDATMVPQEEPSRLLLQKIAAPNLDFNVFHCYDYEVHKYSGDWQLVEKF